MKIRAEPPLIVHVTPEVAAARKSMRDHLEQLSFEFMKAQRAVAEHANVACQDANWEWRTDRRLRDLQLIERECRDRLDTHKRYVATMEVSFAPRTIYVVEGDG